MTRRRMLQLQPWLYRWLLPEGSHSLRRRLLVLLLAPLMLFLLVNSLITYGGALAYSNHVHDRDLADDALTLMQMIATEDPDGRISPQARFLLEYDPGGHNYYSHFSVRSRREGLLAGDARLVPPPGLALGNDTPRLYDTRLGDRRLRAASIALPDAPHAGDTLVVTVAETLRDRHQVARQILLLSIPAQAVLILAVFALVWFGVRTGLRQLDPLTARLARREHDLAPIGEADVPVEIRPLTRTIDGLFARLRGMLALQERFIADAAHQLRTPLAGLRVHAERALGQADPAVTNEALTHILRLVDRANRTSTQLLALTRAQALEHEPGEHARLDLAVLVPELVRQRVQEALATGVDLGYEGPARALWIDGDRHTLQELLDNLIDNSLRYAGRGSTVTSVLDRRADGIVLAVEDDGPGVSPEWLERLGERFFRVPGGQEEGSGLGLAIVQRIAERHRARVRYMASAAGGLRVEVQFPALSADEKNGDA
jgi:two-component system sensor histidine kinase TctE